MNMQKNIIRIVCLGLMLLSLFIPHTHAADQKSNSIEDIEIGLDQLHKEEIKNLSQDKRQNNLKQLALDLKPKKVQNRDNKRNCCSDNCENCLMMSCIACCSATALFAIIGPIIYFQVQNS